MVQNNRLPICKSQAATRRKCVALDKLFALGDGAWVERSVVVSKQLAIKMEFLPAGEFCTREISWACYLQIMPTARKLHSADSGYVLLNWGIA